MDEKKEQAKEESTSKDSGEGDKFETTPVIERARKMAERLEKIQEKLKLENDRFESISAKNALGGEADAGQAPKKEEMTDEEYARRAQAGEFKKK